MNHDELARHFIHLTETTFDNGEFDYVGAEEFYAKLMAGFFIRHAEHYGYDEAEQRMLDWIEDIRYMFVNHD